MPPKAILFDLDGTLTDNRVGITGGCMAAQKAMGLPVSAREELYCFIGPPLVEAFMEKWDLTRAQALEALATTGPITKSRAFLKMYLTPVFIPF